MSIAHITADNFEELVMKSPKPVLLDFWATWCGPCMMIAPTVEQIAEENEHILVGKVDVDQDPSLAVKYGITSIPTLLLIHNGQVVATRVGLQSKAQIEKMIAE